MEIKSVFDNGAAIPKKYTQDGKDMNPPIEISNVPNNAKSLALVVYDIDAQTPGGFTHWIAFNIDPATLKIGEGSVPIDSIQGVNSAGSSSYVGPAPPSGTHRYEFKLYALDIMLKLPGSVSRKELEEAMKGHIIEEALFTGVYTKNED